jgi:hypothetical protein
MLWQTETMLEKNVGKFMTYTKGKHSLVHARYYRWGEVITESDTMPILINEDYNENKRINIHNIEGNHRGYELHDCYYSSIVEFSYYIPKNIKTQLRNKRFVEDYDIQELVDDGWIYCKTEIEFRGPLTIHEKERERCRD